MEIQLEYLYDTLFFIAVEIYQGEKKMINIIETEIIEVRIVR